MGTKTASCYPVALTSWCLTAPIKPHSLFTPSTGGSERKGIPCHARDEKSVLGMAMYAQQGLGRKKQWRYMNLNENFMWDVGRCSGEGWVPGMEEK